jgi:drug/metabolite transporter (DMT)-like permease
LEKPEFHRRPALWGGYLEPLSALFFSAAFLGEGLGLVQIVGAVLILGGAAF